MDGVRKYKMEDGTIIKEVPEVVMGHPCYSYYIGRKFYFGTIQPFPEEALIELFDNGYFD